MSQETALGDVDVDVFMEVRKADGRVLYYRNADGVDTEISKAEYEKGIA